MIFSVSELASFFNGISFGESLKHLRVTATNADKSGELKEWTNVEDLTFLKRSFREGVESRSGQIVGTLPKEIIEEIPMWKWEDSPVESLQSTVEAALMEAWLYGSEYFNFFWKQLTTLSNHKNSSLISSIDINAIKRRMEPNLRERVRPSILFNSRDAVHGWLSNFHLCKVTQGS